MSIQRLRQRFTPLRRCKFDAPLPAEEFLTPGGNLMLTDGFPARLYEDAAIVLSRISRNTYHDIPIKETGKTCTYTLPDRQTVSFPYRIYYVDTYEDLCSGLSWTQRMICHAIFTRSFDGYIREKHVRAILMEDYPDWCFPYILKLSDEYVAEILELIYHEMAGKNTDRMKSFCRLNMNSFLLSHDRMISYWNEFYRHNCFHYRDYIGRKLFSECFGYTRSMERERKGITND